MKKQTLILVMIGVILFIAGSAIAYASVEGASKHAVVGDHRRGTRDHVRRRGQGEHSGGHDRSGHGVERARRH